MSVLSGVVALLWALYLAYPLHQLQSVRWTFFGHAVPVYYFLTALPMAGLAACALILERSWSRWKALWWLLPLVCVPGILFSADPVWSARQWTSFVLRGAAAGGVLFMTVRDGRAAIRTLQWVLPVAAAAALFGLVELGVGRNVLCDRVSRVPIAVMDDAASPFYRPSAEPAGSARPMGTQANRIPYIACLVPFLPLGLWGLKHRGGSRWLYAIASGAICIIVALGGSRSGWLGLAVGGGGGAWLMLRGRLKAARGCALAAGLMLLMPALGRGGIDLDSDSRHRLGALPTLQALGDRWLVGVGYGLYPRVYKPHYQGPFADLATPDDQYLRWLIENGALGLAALLAFLGLLVAAGWKKVQCIPDEADADLYRAMLAGWSGIAATFLFFDGFYWGACDMTFWCFLGLFATCLKEPADA